MKIATIHNKIYEGFGVEIQIEAGSSRVLYRYDTGSMEFEFDLLAEVNDNFKDAFKNLLTQNGIEVETFNSGIAGDPIGHGFYDRVKQINTFCCECNDPTCKVHLGQECSNVCAGQKYLSDKIMGGYVIACDPCGEMLINELGFRLEK